MLSPEPFTVDLRGDLLRVGSLVTTGHSGSVYRITEIGPVAVPRQIYVACGDGTVVESWSDAMVLVPQ